MNFLIHRLFVRALVVHCRESLLMAYNKCRRLLSSRRTVKRDSAATLVGALSPLSDLSIANKKVWRLALDDREQGTDYQYVLVEALLELTPYIVTQLIIGRHIASIKKIPLLVLLNRNSPYEDLCESFGAKKCLVVDETKWHRRSGGQGTTLFHAWWLLRNLKAPDHVYELVHGGIPLGKIVYDHSCKQLKKGTFGQINSVQFTYFVQALQQSKEIAQALSTLDLKRALLVQSETQFLPWGVLAFFCVQKGAGIFKRLGGPRHFTVRHLTKPEDIFSADYRMENNVVRKYLEDEDRKSTVAAAGKVLMQRRFEGIVSDGDLPDTSYVYGSEKENVREFNKLQLLNRLGWTEGKPIVGIFINVVTDGLHEARYRLFRDNILWLRKTLEVAQQVRDVYWLVKPHPSDRWYGTTSAARGELDRIMGDTMHMRIFPDDLSNRCLHDVLDSVVTVFGNSGLEYACLGIPVVTAAETFYSGLGLSIEPRSVGAYESELRNIARLKPLTEKQKSVAHIYHYICRHDASVECKFLTNFDPRTLPQSGNVDQYVIDQIKCIQDYEMKEDPMFRALKYQIENSRTYTLRSYLTD